MRKRFGEQNCKTTTTMSKRYKPQKIHVPQSQPSFMQIDEQVGQQQPKHQNFQACEQQKMTSFPLPDELALRITSSLEVRDLCALACCSKYWRELCGSDCLWASLAQKRWPSLEFCDESTSESSSTAIKRPSDKMWRLFYMEVHNENAARVASVVRYVEESLTFGSLEVGQYQRAIEELHAMKLGYEDVEMLLFKSNLNVQLNLLGLHYCMNWLRVPIKYIVKALQSWKIADREVCVKWWTLGKWSYGYGIRMNDELHVRQFNLLDIVIAKEEEVLAVLYRGAVHEVLRVQITAVNPPSTPLSSQLIF